ncbi:MAG: hypothetical protein VX000_02915, partial [Myxococcota bacterium]|nr:hypothetical protein [Myxococcota bacterium]
MLRWTPGGAVSAPTTVQIRVQRRYPGRVRAGAPAPTRSLSAAELRANIDHFTTGLRGPRSRPCTGLVLSGADVASRPDLPEALDRARAQGVVHVVLHLGERGVSARHLGSLSGRVDVVVIPIQPEQDLARAASIVAAARALGIQVASNTVLRADALPHLPDAIDQLISLRPHSVTLTHPFPAGTDACAAAPLRDVRAALDAALPRLDAAALPTRLKGLPACHLGPHAARLGRTANRWYVDAEHQAGDALLFFPDVVAFHKDDACRFCTADAHCDGSFAAWLARPGTPPLRPLPTGIG